jgi:hypothetical protein
MVMLLFFLLVLFFMDRQPIGGVNGWNPRLAEMNGWQLRSAFAPCPSIEKQKIQKHYMQNRLPPIMYREVMILPQL